MLVNYFALSTEMIVTLLFENVNDSLEHSFNVCCYYTNTFMSIVNYFKQI